MPPEVQGIGYLVGTYLKFSIQLKYYRTISINVH